MRFALKAVDSGNRVVVLELEATDEATARDLALRKGFAVLTMRRRGLALRPASPFPTNLFSIELLSLLDAGLNVVEALQTLADKGAGGAGRGVLSGLVEALHRGESFSQAVAHFPDAFPPLYVATIRSSERTGDLKEALSRYVAYREELDRLRKKVVAALLYPAILVSVGTLVLAFLLLYVVPRFARVYEEVSAELPFFSALLLGTGRWIEGNLPLLAGLTAACATACFYALSRPDLRAACLEMLWRVPAFGERMRIYQLARLYRTFGMLLRAGVPALRALPMLAGLLPPNMRLALNRAGQALQEGRSMSMAFTSAGLATAVATRMLEVGERSGRMGELMDRIARFYDDQTARDVEAFTRVFEPLLMAVLGLLVGGVVVLMYMPVFELAGSLQ